MKLILLLLIMASSALCIELSPGSLNDEIWGDKETTIQGYPIPIFNLKPQDKDLINKLAKLALENKPIYVIPGIYGLDRTALTTSTDFLRTRNSDGPDDQLLRGFISRKFDYMSNWTKVNRGHKINDRAVGLAGAIIPQPDSYSRELVQILMEKCDNDFMRKAPEGMFRMISDMEFMIPRVEYRRVISIQYDHYMVRQLSE
jgi:hypothetical protein